MPIARFIAKNRHGSRYYFRCIIPVDLRRRFGGRREFRISLDTIDKKLATREALALWLDLHAS